MSVCMFTSVVPGMQMLSGVVPSSSTWRGSCVRYPLTFDHYWGQLWFLFCTELALIIFQSCSKLAAYQRIILVALALLDTFQTWKTISRGTEVELDGEDGGRGQGGQEDEGRDHDLVGGGDGEHLPLWQGWFPLIGELQRCPSLISLDWPSDNVFVSAE